MMTVPESGFRIPLNIFKRYFCPRHLSQADRKCVHREWKRLYDQVPFSYHMTYLDCQPESLCFLLESCYNFTYLDGVRYILEIFDNIIHFDLETGSIDTWVASDIFIIH